MADELPGYRHVYSGKVRDLYEPVGSGAAADQLLMVASDRISAYDHVLDPAIPDKGAVLTQLSQWWFGQMADLVPNHVVSTEVPEAVRGRAVLVERLEMLPVECVARAYLTGGGLADYQATGVVSGVRLPDGLVDGSPLPAPVFTPSSKAEVGEHDEPITAEQVADIVGAERAAQLAELTTKILARANEIAAPRGVIIADTKVEFGVRPDGTLVLADELLTPDSSRFWPADRWEPGHRQPSFDKQYVRDWLDSPESGWDRADGTSPPRLPEEVVEQTRATYLEAYRRITGNEFAAG